MNIFFKKLSHLTLISASLFAPQAIAGSLFSYDFAQVAYVDMDGGVNGLSIAGSHDIQPKIAIIASYLSTNGRSNDFSLLAVGASHHSQFKQLKNADLSLHAELLHGSLERGGQTDSENGLHVGANLRLEMQTNLEVAADISYTTLYDNDLQFTPAIILHITPTIATEISYQISDSDTLMFAVRILLK